MQMTMASFTVDNLWSETNVTTSASMYVGCFAYQCELVVDLHEVLRLVLLQHHKVVQVGAAPASAVLAVHHVRLLAVALARHKQQVKHFHLHGTEHSREVHPGPGMCFWP